MIWLLIYVVTAVVFAFVMTVFGKVTDRENPDIVGPLLGLLWPLVFVAAILVAPFLLFQKATDKVADRWTR